MQQHLCQVKAQYVALNEQEDGVFLQRYGPVAVGAAAARKAQWLADMVREHGTRTRTCKARRNIIEVSVQRLTEKMLSA